MIDKLPRWAHPAARVSSRLAILGLILCVLAGLLVFGPTPIETWMNGVVPLVGATVGALALITAAVIALSIWACGRKRGEW